MVQWVRSGSCAWAVKTRGAVRLALNFFCSTFFGAKKAGITEQREKIERAKTLTAMLRQALHNKAHESLYFECSFIMQEQYGHLKKLMLRNHSFIKRYQIPIKKGF